MLALFFSCSESVIFLGHLSLDIYMGYLWMPLLSGVLCHETGDWGKGEGESDEQVISVKAGGLTHGVSPPCSVLLYKLSSSQ